MTACGRALKLVKDSFDHRRGEFFRREAVATSDHVWNELCFSFGACFGERCDDVEVEWIAGRAGFFGPIEYGNALRGLRERVDKSLAQEGTIETYFNYAHFFILAI